ncbi:MAG TPA: TIGR02147 family protein [Bdellovibrionales bacterium]|nr:TIGR02147 family protein [Bdellovibrionales bacterium]
MLTGPLDFRNLMRQELLRRSRDNPRYTLSAFARDLRLSPSRVCEVLSGKQGLSRPTAEKVARQLGLSLNESELFCDLVESEHARSREKRELASARVKRRMLESQMQMIGLDVFEVIADWHHIAIMQLMQCEGFRGEPGWIAKALEIDKAQAASALARLERLELVKKDRHGQFKPFKEFVTTPDQTPSLALRHFHRQVLTKALRALDQQPVNERDISAIVVPFDARMTGELKTMIKEFRRKALRRASEGVRRDQLYCLSIQFFNLTPNKEKRP